MSTKVQEGKGGKRPAEGMAGRDSGGGSRRLEVVMKRSSLALVEVEFPLFRKYQMLQHNEPSYKVTGPNIPGNPRVNIPLVCKRADAAKQGSFIQGG